MPLYEFLCQGCQHRFEVLVLPHNPSDTRTCPSCQGQDVERVLSSFAVSSDSTRQVNFSKARKHLQKDAKEKKDAEHKALLEHHDDH